MHHGRLDDLDPGGVLAQEVERTKLEDMTSADVADLLTKPLAEEPHQWLIGFQ